MRLSFTIVAAWACAALSVACAPPPGSLASGPLPAGAHLLPAHFENDRLYGTPVLPRGDTAVIFLDTGGGTLVWEPYVKWMGLTIDSIVGARGAKIPVTEFPAFRNDRTLPSIAAKSVYGNHLVVRSADPTGFVAWIARSTQAQFGATWFGDRIWTFDYPGNRLLLHDASPPSSVPPEHQVPVRFRTDSGGARIDHSPQIDVMVDGDTLAMIFDTGATIWLTAAARSQLHDGRPSERATSHVQSWWFARWKQRHPDWPVIEAADQLTRATLIRVPSVRIAGYDVGPVWFSVLGGPAEAPPGAGRFGGTIGGNVLREFSVMLDYRRGIAEFTRPGSTQPLTAKTR